MEIYEVVKKLIGEIEPVGETHADTTRLRNLKKVTSLVESLVLDIEKVSRHKDRVEYSMREAGKTAYDFRNSLTGWED